MKHRLLIVAGLAAALALQAQDPPEVASVREYAQNYVRSLPDYTCMQETKRTSAGQQLRNVQTDTILEELSFVGGGENYKVLKINGADPKGVTHAQLGGAISEGEFGGILNQIFGPRSLTAFRPPTSGKLQGRAMTILPFRVPQPTGFPLEDFDLRRMMRVAFEGSVWVNPESHAVMRIEAKFLNIPKESRLIGTQFTLDYKPVEISGQDYLLPSQFTWNWQKRADSGHPQESGSNVTTFSGCRKFTTESNISFDK